MNPTFLIIAGSEKSGTTSVFQYLTDCGEFTVSIKKETDYFRKDSDLSLADYLTEFEKPKDANSIYLEASPGYLSESHISAANMAKVLDNYHLIFCLRNPLDRLISSFLFHKSRLYIPKDYDFETYFDECMRFESQGTSNSGLIEWCLKVPDAGKYYKHLKDFLDVNHHQSLTIVHFEDLAKDPETVCKSILENLGKPSDFFSTYQFEKSNITSGHKNDVLQKIALFVNKKLEALWIKNPGLKRTLLGLYNKLNGKQKEEVVVSSALKAKILNYYRSDLEALKSLEFANPTIIEGWLKKLAE